jgi:hypothetical protein
MTEMTTAVEKVERPQKSQRPHGQAEIAAGPDASYLLDPADRPVSPPRCPPEQILALQRLAGNRAVAATMQKVQGNLHQVAAHPAARHLAPSVASLSGQANGTASVQRAGPVDDAIASNAVAAISALSDVDLKQASVDQRVKMIDVVLAGGGGEVLARLWDSFGAGLTDAANNHSSEWHQSFVQFPETMRHSVEVTTLQAAFKDDICGVAQAYLTDNDGVVKQEMQQLGIPEDGDSAQPSAQQDAALAKTQADAAKLSDAQKNRENLRQTEVAYHRKVVESGGSELPEGGADNVENMYEPVLFDPDNQFDASSQPTDYEPGLKTWEDTNKLWVQLSNVISAYLSTNPALYALVGSDQSGESAGSVATVSPQQARKTIGDQLRTVRANIEKTRPMVPGLALQMTPIQEQMLANSVAANFHLGRDWSQTSLHEIGEDVAAQQQPGPWWQQLGLAALEMAAYVVSGLATGGIGPLLLAGGQAAISIGKYQALEAASHATVTPDTVLVKQGEVDAAAVEAVIATVVFFVSGLAELRMAFAARIASPAFESLARELGEDVARQLVMELAPEAVAALKDKLGAQLLKDLVAGKVGGAAIQKLAEELGPAEIQSLLQRAPTGLGPILEQAGSARLAESLLQKCPDAQQLTRLMNQVDRAETLDKYLGRFTPDELEQRISETLLRDVPQGLTEEEFVAMSGQVRAAASKYSADIRVHGSRAAGAGLGDADLDIAIRVDEARFKQIIKDRFKTPNPGSADERTMTHAIETGKIQRGELGLSGVGKQVGRDLAIKKVDISVVKIGGPTDNGPWIPLR